MPGLWISLICTAALSAPAEVPNEAQEVLRRLEGTWNGQWTYGDDTGRNRLSVVWRSGKSCLLMDLHVRGTLDGTDFDTRGTSIMGWDPSSRQLVETHFNEGGTTISQRWTVKSADSLVGTVRWVEADGRVFEGEGSLKFNGDDSFTVTSENLAGGDERKPKLEIKYERVHEK